MACSDDFHPQTHMRTFIQKAFVPAALLAAIGYPLYLAYDVAVSASVEPHCSRSARGDTGLFCAWGQRLGEALFGADRAHLGFSLLVGGSALAMLGFLAFALWGARSGLDAPSSDFTNPSSKP